MNASKLVILDRDGVINEDSDAYIKTPEEWRPLPGSTRPASSRLVSGTRLVTRVYPSLPLRVWA